VLFREGSFVTEGDILFVIEQDRYQSTVDLRAAEFHRADREYKRQESLNKQSYASEAKLESAKADMLQAKANLALAKIDLNHTVIKAPISGYIGKALVTEGNYVNASSQVLARIVQTDPIRVVFSMADKDYLEAHQKFLDKKGLLRTRIVLSNGQIIENHIISHFLNNEANTETATIAVYIEYENKDNLLMPGNYVDVMVSTEAPKRAMLIPQSAVSQDEQGNFVYVVNGESIAEERRVTLGDLYNKRQVVLSGLKTGENVIVKGIQKVADGQKVKTEEIEASAPTPIKENE
jgi:RND family efflux transporter MFP subunit